MSSERPWHFCRTYKKWRVNMTTDDQQVKSSLHVQLLHVRKGREWSGRLTSSYFQWILYGGVTWSAGQCFVFKSLYQMIKTGAQDFHQDKLRVKTCLAILIGISIGHRGHFLPGSSIHCQVKSRHRSRSETGRHLHHIIRMVVVWYIRSGYYRRGVFVWWMMRG